MENKINIAELLKDCPKGMELYSPLCGKCKFDSLNWGTIICKKQNTQEITFTSEGYYMLPVFDGCECVLFPSKENRDWSTFQRPLKDGDVVVTETSNNYVFYSIYKTIEYKKVLTYIDYTPDNDSIISIGNTLCLINEIIEQRLATEEEKQKLFDAIKAKGYKWNPETKTLEKSDKPKFKVGDIIKDKNAYKVKIIEVCEDKEYYIYDSLKGIGRISFSDQNHYELVSNKSDISTLKPFDKVLVRDSDYNPWRCAFYSHYVNNDIYPFKMCAIEGFIQCIPYEGNEHLLGTTDDCDDFYKTW